MTYSGHVENGLVIFDAAPGLPDGTTVVVTVVGCEAGDSDADANLPTIYEQLKPFIGKIEGMPEDASQNVDHYLYGRPKK